MHRRQVIQIVYTMSLLLVCFTLTACDDPTPNAAVDSLHEKNIVAVTIAPQAWLVRQIAGDRVQVMTLVAAGDSPEYYQPSDRQISQLMAASVYFTVGVASEHGRWFDAIARHSKLRIWSSYQNITRRMMQTHHFTYPINHTQNHPQKQASSDTVDQVASQLHNHVSHQIKTQTHHDHSGEDPHIWTSPTMLKIMAQNIYNGLCATTAEKKDRDDYLKNFKQLTQQLDLLDQKLKVSFEPYQGSTIFVYHPAWGYLTDAYGLKQMAIEIQGQKPSDQELTQLRKMAKKKAVRVLFYQRQNSNAAIAEIAKALNIKMQAIDPLAENVIENIQHVGQLFVEALHDN